LLRQGLLDIISRNFKVTWRKKERPLGISRFEIIGKMAEYRALLKEVGGYVSQYSLLRHQ
jgi:hypothetical protein